MIRAAGSWRTRRLQLWKTIEAPRLNQGPKTVWLQGVGLRAGCKRRCRQARLLARIGGFKGRCVVSWLSATVGHQLQVTPGRAVSYWLLKLLYLLLQLPRPISSSVQVQS